MSSISSVLAYGCVCWGGNASKDRDRLEKTIRKAGGVIGRQQDTFDSVCHRRLTDRLNKILSDDTHPLTPEIDSRLIDRSGRLRVPFTHTHIHKKRRHTHTHVQKKKKEKKKKKKNTHTRLRHSFILKAVQTFNQSHEKHCL